MMILCETSVAEVQTGWLDNTVTIATNATIVRPIASPKQAMPCARRPRQDWLAEAMQCLSYENLSARSPD